MSGKLNIFMEETENSKFVVIGFGSFGELINYQVKMLTNNKIRYLLPVTLQQMDGNIKLYYDISKKVSIREFGQRAKFTNEQFLDVLNSIIDVDNEIDEFQLVNSGILFDPDWTFVDRDGENIEYIYIPNATEPSDAADIKVFLMKLLQGGCVDSSAQVLVTNLFALLQDPNMSLRDLKELIYKFEGKNNMVFIKKRSSENNGISVDKGIEENEISAAGEFDEQMKKMPVPTKPSFANKPVVPSLSKEALKQGRLCLKRNGKTKESIKINEPSVSKENKEKKSTLPITAMAAGNLLVLALMYKVYTLGLFNGSGGGIDITKIVAVAAAVVIIDGILIKNIFFNNKDKSENVKLKNEIKLKDKKEKAIPKAAKTMPEKPVIQEAAKAEVPVGYRETQRTAEIPRAAQVPDIVEIPKAAHIPNTVETPRAAQIPRPAATASIAEKPKDVVIPNGIEASNINIPYNEGIMNDSTVLMSAGRESGIEYDETVLMVTNEPKGYLERIENGEIADKYVIKKDKVIIGRLRSQVDMTVLNPKVGKIHSEISYKDGKFFIKDICSKNGTYLENSNERIKTDTEFELKDGEKFRLADSVFCIHFIK